MTKALTKLELSIEAKEKRLAQLKAQKQKMEALERTRISTLARKQDTRRKVLAGAMLLEMMERNSEVKHEMLGRLSKFLTRPEDRTLFGLATGSAPSAAPPPGPPA